MSCQDDCKTTRGDGGIVTGQPPFISTSLSGETRTQVCQAGAHAPLEDCSSFSMEKGARAAHRLLKDSAPSHSYFLRGFRDHSAIAGSSF